MTTHSLIQVIDIELQPLSIGNDLDPTPGRQSRPWHPKITPYRLAFISTTLVLGTTKAVLTQQGRTIAPITLEWISGVLLALVFYIANTYDTESHPPRYLSSFFTFDCMDILWNSLSLLSMPRPSYVSNELPSLPSTKEGHPPMTFYRIVLNLAVALFGMSKAALSYSRSSTPVTWLDWFIGTILAIVLYILGLYEYNSTEKWAPFFLKDRGISTVIAVSQLLFVLALVAFFISCFGLTIIWDTSGKLHVILGRMITFEVTKHGNLSNSLARYAILDFFRHCFCF
ncbi:hypothetical protein GALMADRAFT_137197 [Galerina marginata CBS 339.88]|uniref:Uncharacterized protein n=1 Tax=Galerina marginata (strain CBS 339.88) TaxID=685588 RepID=A0A067T825_GALM3|nr:hypothetical protein GALMADRAFT_137197 [Galerina marginata CBS 339.88]